MKVNVNNPCKYDLDAGALRKACAKVLKSEGVRDDVILSLTAVSEEDMAGLNGRFLKRVGPTDVIAFPMEEEIDKGYLLGDVVVCPEVIMKRQEEYGVEKERLIEYVAVHGVLHLLGYEDDDARGFESMELRQREILEIKGRSG